VPRDINIDPITPPDPTLAFEIAVIDLYTLDRVKAVHLRQDQLAGVVLVEMGYLGSSPDKPELAISLKTLELYTILRRRKPSYSFEAFAKVLCDLYQVC
jgi:hypothetical protein